MSMKCTPYILSKPYPTVSEQPPDPAVCRDLLALYAGDNGEMTAVTQYLYNHLITGMEKLQSVAELFECVSLTEMHHLELLGELILAYGGDPGYLSYPDDRRREWWTGANVNYHKGVDGMLRRSIEAEKQAVRAYRRLAARLTDGNASALLHRIALDEQHHIELFEQMLGQYASCSGRG